MGSQGQRIQTDFVGKTAGIQNGRFRGGESVSDAGVAFIQPSFSVFVAESVELFAFLHNVFAFPTKITIKLAEM